jgi:hypothetical protein
MVSKGSALYHRCSFDCRPGGRWGNTKQVVTRWWRLVAFIKALDHLHQAILAVLHHCTAMAIKIASNGGTFVRCHRLFYLIKMKPKDHVMVHLI